MATYKVIQDIEAEDKFLGPLTLKQFIFGAAAAFFGYLTFFAFIKNALFLVPIFLTPTLLGAFLAVPWSSDQPTEIWVLAKLRFKLKPKVRIWDQAGLEELVTITVPKKIERVLTNGLDQTEVQSRLRALAETIDTRGWATKNATLNTAYALNVPSADQRLINPASIPQQVPEIDTSGYTDVLDDDTRVADNFNQMIAQSEQQRRQETLAKMERVRHGESANTEPTQQIAFAPPSTLSDPAALTPAEEERLIAQQLRAKQADTNLVNKRMKTISVIPGAGSLAGTMQQPIADDPIQDPVVDDQAQTAVVDEPVQAQATMTNTPGPDILSLSQNNDLNIATLARQAQKHEEPEDGEVVISLR